MPQVSHFREYFLFHIYFIVYLQVKISNTNIMSKKTYNDSIHFGGPNIGTPFLKECFRRSGIKNKQLSRLDMYEIFSVAVIKYIEHGKDVVNKNEKNIAYFLKILRNKVADFFEEEKKAEQSEEQIERENNMIRDYINEQISNATDLLKVSQEKLNKLVHRMIQDDRLPKHCTKILETIFNKLEEGKEYNEISNKELAEQLGFTLNYLRNRKSYCLQETKKQYINDPVVQELYYQ